MQGYRGISPIFTKQELLKELKRIRKEHKEDLKNFKSLIKDGQYYKEDRWILERNIRELSILLGRVYFGDRIYLPSL